MSGGTILRADVAMGLDGKSRGFGMVTFATESDAERARCMFNGCVIPYLCALVYIDINMLC